MDRAEEFQETQPSSRLPRRYGCCLTWWLRGVLEDNLEGSGAGVLSLFPHEPYRMSPKIKGLPRVPLQGPLGSLTSPGPCQSQLLAGPKQTQDGLCHSILAWPSGLEGSPLPRPLGHWQSWSPTQPGTTATPGHAIVPIPQDASCFPRQPPAPPPCPWSPRGRSSQKEAALVQESQDFACICPGGCGA